MSALRSIADIARTYRDFRVVPVRDIADPYSNVRKGENEADIGTSKGGLALALVRTLRLIISMAIQNGQTLQQHLH
jgi:hypothetical protein